MTLKEEILKSCPFLFSEYGFKVIDDAQPVRATLVVAQSNNIRIRFIFDRAYYFLDIGTTDGSGKWFGYYETIEEMRRSSLIIFDKKYSNKLGALSRALRETYPTVSKYILEKNEVPPRKPTKAQ